MEKEYDNEDEIKCPYCGYEEGDSWEVNNSDDNYECVDCGKRFILEIEHSVSYSTKRQKCSGEHDFRFNLCYVNIEDRDYKKDKDILRNKEDFEYTESYECINCCENEWKKLSKRDFKNKHPEKYKMYMDIYKRKLEVENFVKNAKNGNHSQQTKQGFSARTIEPLLGEKSSLSRTNKIADTLNASHEKEKKQ